MKTTFSLVFLLFVGPGGAWAGNGRCGQNQFLVCTAYYNGNNQIRVVGPTDRAQVLDLQPDPKEASTCEADAVLYTKVGKFVATYDESDHTLRAWLANDTQYSTIIKSQKLNLGQTLKTTVPSLGMSDFISTSFECTLTVQ